MMSKAMPKTARAKALARRRTYVLKSGRARSQAFRSLNAQLVSDAAGVRNLLNRGNTGSLWISYDKRLTRELLKESSQEFLGDAVFVHDLAASVIPLINNRFKHYAFAGGGSFLPEEELAEVLAADNCADLFIGCLVDHDTKSITLWRGNLTSITVPFGAFPKSGDGTKPDFKKATIVDFGQTLQLGAYEAAADAIFYEYDAEYRRRIKGVREKSEQSFGASLKRLRKQLGLRREDFAPEVSAKTIARIERNEGDRVQAKTLRALSARLGVPAEEIESY
jgi:DNA-binding XRE family transcriptional regulator